MAARFPWQTKLARCTAQRLSNRHAAYRRETPTADSTLSELRDCSRLALFEIDGNACVVCTGKQLSTTNHVRVSLLILCEAVLCSTFCRCLSVRRVPSLALLTHQTSIVVQSHTCLPTTHTRPNTHTYLHTNAYCRVKKAAKSKKEEGGLTRIAIVNAGARKFVLVGCVWRGILIFFWWI